MDSDGSPARPSPPLSFLLACMAVIESVSAPLLLEDLMVIGENGSMAEH